MQNWRKFWNEYPATAGEQEFLRQVGHTVAGLPYSPQQFEAMVAGIRAALQLSPEDVVLDVCCGNGVITKELAKHCGRILGVDFSVPLIAAARKFHGGTNISFQTADALEIGSATLDDPGPFSRVLIYAALQHFAPEDLPVLLNGFLRHADDMPVILLGGVLDAGRKQLYLDTPEKLAMYETYRKEGRDRLGTWWCKDHIRDVCNGLGLGCEIDDSSEGRPGGHYRFDARITG